MGWPNMSAKTLRGNLVDFSLAGIATIAVKMIRLLAESKDNVRS
jgi:hypothetical protein